jgi:predicted HicB family RNase H-like nuclease
MSSETKQLVKLAAAFQGVSIGEWVEQALKQKAESDLPENLRPKPPQQD